MAREGRGGPFSTVIGAADRELRLAQPGDLARSTSPGGKGDHQDRPVADIMKTLGAAGRKHLYQDVTSDRLGALTFLGRGVARTARRIVDFSEGEEKTPVRPRHFVSVDQLASRLRTVSGACGPEDRRKPCSRRLSTTAAGIPC
jgi:hypothetical protein